MTTQTLLAGPKERPWHGTPDLPPLGLEESAETLPLAPVLAPADPVEQRRAALFRDHGAHWSNQLQVVLRELEGAALARPHPFD